jgi:flagellar biogenesis protein FliO
MQEIQHALSVLFVLALLGGSLFWLRRKGVARFAIRGIGRAAERRMQMVERLPLTPQHSLHLVRIGGRLLLIAVSPGSCAVLDGNWVPADRGELD